MNRYALLPVLAMFGLSGCGLMDRFRGVPDSNPAPGISAAPGPAETAPAPQTGGAIAAEAFDITTEAERAAVIAAPSSGSGREIGRVVVGLGPVTEQGFWLRSTLVTTQGKGRVVTATGASVAVDLLVGEGGALLSLAAFRALGLGLTELPEVVVLAH